MKDEVIAKKIQGMMTSYENRHYENNTALRAVVNVIPYIGSSLDVLFASKGKEIIQKRINTFLSELHLEMEKVKEEKVDKAYLESEEFFDLLISALEKVSKTRSKRKISLYAKILKNAVLVDKVKDHDEPEKYLSVVAELSEDEILLAKIIYDQQKERPHSGENELRWAKNKGWNELPKLAKDFSSPDDLCFLLNRIAKSGLLREITGTFLDYQGGVYVITETFRKIMDFLDHDWPTI